LVDIAAGSVQVPTARRITIAVKLNRVDVVFGANAPCNSQTLAGFGIHQHHSHGGWLGVRDVRCEYE
jgi:hypothetical protein